jgi:hypothetical protein
LAKGLPWRHTEVKLYIVQRKEGRSYYYNYYYYLSHFCWIFTVMYLEQTMSLGYMLQILLLLLFSPLWRVFIHIFLRQTMSLRNTMLQLFCRSCVWCLYH